MRKIIYYVATSIDGFISGPDDDISGFVQDGDGVEKYLEDLQNFNSVIMGRKTYEFGYLFGLKPGEPAYQHMDHYIFSETLRFENPNSKVHICGLNIEKIQQLKEKSKTDIYLCGGGAFAGWLLDHEMIDFLIIKLNPLVLGRGVRLFGSSTKKHQLKLLESNAYEHGLQIMNYHILYQ